MLNTKLFTCLFAVSFASLAVAQDRSTAQVKAAFEKAKIPQDLHIKFNPEFLLDVTFPQPGGQSVPVSAGIVLPRSETAGPPQFAIGNDFGLEIGQRFVIAAVDPDAPTPQNTSLAQIRHFVGSDFVFKSGKISVERPLKNLTVPVSPWLQPSPPAGSDPHRYIFLIYRQPKGFDNQTVVTPGGGDAALEHFDVAAFAKETNLGNPIAGTFIIVSPDACESIITI
ncbi:PEBP-like protein [Irpex rosettiformis]|uniref:PEBP-like protein n=1 Tax=Irpex rosettiformis TaxID=378272 RepID=A0ACB8U6N5_9APHY|nr:PEBP-like protein [Irpex rosettiformis]